MKRLAKRSDNGGALTILAIVVLGLLLLGKAPVVPPAPVVGALRVLIVEETAERGSYTESQREVLTATAAGSVIDYLRSHKAEWRKLDKDDDLSKESATWQAAFTRRGSAPLPWYTATNGKAGSEGTIATPAATLAALKRLGGP